MELTRNEHIQSQVEEELEERLEGLIETIFLELDSYSEKSAEFIFEAPILNKLEKLVVVLCVNLLDRGLSQVPYEEKITIGPILSRYLEIMWSKNHSFI